MPSYREIMERHIGRKLSPQEVVHHIDGDQGNNDPSNLEVKESHSAHMKECHKRPTRVKEIRDKTFLISMNEEEINDLKKKAYSLGMSAGAYLRFLFYKEGDKK